MTQSVPGGRRTGRSRAAPGQGEGGGREPHRLPPSFPRQWPAGGIALARIFPAHGSRLSHRTDDDRERVEAGDHLQSTVRALADVGVGVRGKVGAEDPIQSADGVVIACGEDGLLLEEVEPSRIAERLEVGARLG